MDPIPMSTCGTDRRRREAHRAGLLLAAAVLLAAVARAEPDATDGDLSARGEVTLGANLYSIDGPWDDNHLTSYWDQYRYTRDKTGDPAHFVDVMHLDLGLVRSDDTFLARLERVTPNALNDRAELEVDWEGLGFDLDYHRYRSDELRFFPEGTFQDDPAGPFPIFGTQYTPDTLLSDLDDQNHRFWVRRTGVGGEVRLRPEGFALASPVLDEVSFRSSYEERRGWRQDSFLLDLREPAPQSLRFRGNRRKLDQEVTTIAGGLVLSPVPAVTTDLDVGFQRFRENAPVVDFGSLAATNPCPSPDPCFNVGAISPAQAARPFNFVPDTDRLSGSVRIRGRAGPATLHGGAFVTHLEQSNRSPIQRMQGLDQGEVTTWSLHAAFDTPIGESFELSGFAKWSERRNGLDENDFESDFAGSLQVDPILRRRDELEGQIELGMRPQSGALVAGGYRFDRVDRNLRYEGALLQPDLGLIEGDGELHTLYLRGRARLLRSIALSGELGWEHRPEVDFPRDSKHAVYFDAKASTALPEPIPATFGVFGGVRDAKGSGIALRGRTSTPRKNLDRLEWNYGLTVTAAPTGKTTLSTTFVQMRDEQDFPYLRTDFQRFFGNVAFGSDPDRPRYASDVKSLMLGASQEILESVDASLFTNVTWVRAWFKDDSTTSAALESANEIESRIFSAGGGLGWRPRPGLRLDLGYRFDRYDDRKDLEPFETDADLHTVTLAATISLDLFERHGP